MGSRSRPHRVLSVCVCVCVSRCLWVRVIEANPLQLRVITIGLYQFLSRSLSCQILAVCGRRLRGVSGSWFSRFLSPAAFLDSDRRRLVCPLLPCATRLSPYGKLRFCLRRAPRLPTEAPPLCLRKAPFSFSLCITSCNKLSFSATESSRLHCDRLCVKVTSTSQENIAMSITLPLPACFLPIVHHFFWMHMNLAIHLIEKYDSSEPVMYVFNIFYLFIINN